MLEKMISLKDIPSDIPKSPKNSSSLLLKAESDMVTLSFLVEGRKILRMLISLMNPGTHSHLCLHDFSHQKYLYSGFFMFSKAIPSFRVSPYAFKANNKQHHSKWLKLHRHLLFHTTRSQEDKAASE